MYMYYRSQKDIKSFYPGGGGGGGGGGGVEEENSFEMENISYISSYSFFEDEGK